MGIWDWMWRDEKIDGLIEENTAKPCPGMERPDIERMRHLGKVNREKSYKADARSETKAVTA